MALDANYETVVDNLEDIRWVREWNGRIYTRQLGPPIVIDKFIPWATVLIPLQDWYSEKKGWEKPRFVLSRWLKERGAWRVQGYFRISFKAVSSLSSFLTDEYMKEIEDASCQK